MSNQQVPWAPGRRALVRFGGVWREAAAIENGILTDETAETWKVWTIIGEDGQPVSDGDVRVEDASTYFLPRQCPRCYEVDDHAAGCMVAANLARGVPAFWAPWAMWEMPHNGRGFCLYLVVGAAQTLFHVERFNGGWMSVRFHAVGDATTWPVVAIGPEGPTLAPWEKT